MIQALLCPTLIAAENYLEDVLEEIDADENQESIFEELHLSELQDIFNEVVKTSVNKCRELGLSSKDLIHIIGGSLNEASESHCHKYNNNELDSIPNRFFMYNDFVGCVCFRSGKGQSFVNLSNSYQNIDPLNDYQKGKLIATSSEYVSRMIEEDEDFLDNQCGGTLFIFLVEIRFCMIETPFISYTIKL